MIELDHLAVSGETRDAAQAHVEERLGVAMQQGGAHDIFSTHNTLLGLEDGLYLEAIATNPEAPVPLRPRWFDLDNFAGPARLTNWICRTADMEDAMECVPRGMGDPVDLARGTLRWRMAVPESGILPFDNCAPALIQWQTRQHPAQMLAPSGVRLRRLTIRHPQADDMRKIFATHMTDDRITYEAGPACLSAAFHTPHGERVMEG